MTASIEIFNTAVLSDIHYTSEQKKLSLTTLSHLQKSRTSSSAININVRAIDFKKMYSLDNTIINGIGKNKTWQLN